DAMEWDYSGEFVMYDALNEIQSSFGNGIQYWDISFLNAWNNQTQNFPDGQISKLYNSLPENISVGNPAFSKNSPYIITFDFVQDYYDNFGALQSDYWVIAANIESGTANNIYHNTTVGYPSYSRLDDKILFTYDDNGNILLATINVQPGDKTLPVDGTDVILINGAQKGVWFNVGIRDFTATQDIPDRSKIILSPQPASDLLTIRNGTDTPLTDYTILSLTGNDLMHDQLGRDQAISIGDLPAGMYFLSVRNEKGEGAVMKFVKQ
ncbi:MAG TPA: T9SS type A sorting domain-containing protein, partial [Saprospiraceae bacterium]|nr:T9SS type A sorting domain-containing protein [Saprospiraceae bacterium]